MSRLNAARKLIGVERPEPGVFDSTAHDALIVPLRERVTRALDEVTRTEALLAEAMSTLAEAEADASAEEASIDRVLAAQRAVERPKIMADQARKRFDAAQAELDAAERARTEAELAFLEQRDLDGSARLVAMIEPRLAEIVRLCTDLDASVDAETDRQRADFERVRQLRAALNLPPRPDTHIIVLGYMDRRNRHWSLLKQRVWQTPGLRWLKEL